MYSEKYNKLFWGLIITLLDFRIMGFNILPDIVGYIMIIYALTDLEKHHSDYEKAKPFAVALLIFSITDIYQTNGNILNGFTINNSTIIFMIISSITLILDTFMVYYIINPIIQLVQNSNFYELKKITKFRWKAYLVVNLIFLAIIPFTINLSEHVITWITIVLVLLMFVVKILFISLIKRLSKIY